MYHGADSTDGGRGTSVWNHFIAKFLGFVLVPAAGAVVTRLAAPLVIKAGDSPQKQAETLTTLTSVAHALGAAGSWYASGHLFEDSPSTQAFLRGGMWAEGLATLFSAGAPTIQSSMEQPLAPPVAAVVKGLDAKSNLDALVSLLQGNAAEALPRLQAAPRRQFGR